MLKETCMLECQPSDTPMDPSNKLALKENSTLVDKGDTKDQNSFLCPV